MQIEAPIQKKTCIQAFFAKNMKTKNGRCYPQQRDKYLAGALALLSGKFWLVQKFLGCKTYFFLSRAEDFQIDLGIFSYIQNYQNVQSCHINTFSKQNTKSFSNYGLVSGKARNIQDLLKSFFSGKVLIILDFF